MGGKDNNDIDKSLPKDKPFRSKRDHGLQLFSNVRDYFESKNSSELLANKYVEGGVRTIATSVAVATALYPVEVVRTQIQAGSRATSPFLWGSRAFVPLVNGFMAANKSSLVKNSVLSNKETVSTHIESTLGERPPETNVLRRNQGLLFTTGIIAGLDTIFTQYYSNIGVLNKLGSSPTMDMFQKLQFAKEGMMIRATRNYVTTLACIGISSNFIALTENAFPQNKQFTNLTIGSIAAGFASAPLINSFDVLYKCKIKGFDLQSMRTPSYTDVAEQLWKEGKGRAFLRGTGITGCYTGLAFITINGVAVLLDKHVFTKEQAKEKPAANPHSFFAPAGKVIEINTEEATHVQTEETSLTPGKKG